MLITLDAAYAACGPVNDTRPSGCRIGDRVLPPLGGFSMLTGTSASIACTVAAAIAGRRVRAAVGGLGAPPTFWMLHVDGHATARSSDRCG